MLVIEGHVDPFDGSCGNIGERAIVFSRGNFIGEVGQRQRRIVRLEAPEGSTATRVRHQLQAGIGRQWILGHALSPIRDQSACNESIVPCPMQGLLIQYRRSALHVVVTQLQRIRDECFFPASESFGQ